MGYVHKPIPVEVYLAFPPQERHKLYLKERAQLVRIHRRQGATLSFGYGVAIALIIFAALLLAATI